MKLEAEEIGDKEAEESPVDDDEEEEPNEESLENTEKRKERLKRLLHEKSKKGVTGPEKSVTILDATDSQTGDEQVLDPKSEKPVDETEKVCSENTVLPENPKSPMTPKDKTENVDGDIEMISVEAKNTCDTEPDQKEAPEIIQKELANPVTTETKDDNDNETEDNRIPLEKGTTSDHADKAHLISDDSSKLESDVDELHLLQKLHSETEANTSTQDASDSESPIAISDTLESSSDNKKQTASDVISIENSSYSESEIVSKPFNAEVEKETDPLADKVVAEIVDENTEIECSNLGIEKKLVRSNNDEYNESIEDILLASTDDEVETDRGPKQRSDEECVNLKDDTISIGDTVVEGVDKTQSNPATDDSSPGKQDDASSVESVAVVSLQSDSPETNMDVESKDDTEKPHAEDVLKENTNTAQEQNIEPSNEQNGTQTIELKESSPEEITDTTDKSNDSSDCQKKEQLPEKVNDNAESTKSLECEVLQKQNVEHLNESSSAKV